MRRRPILGWVLATIVALGAWFLLAPERLGGTAAYVQVQGTSMLPTLHTGDLLVLRANDRYAIGDVVAYRSDMAGAVVVHRVIGIDGDRYVMKGDNNDFLDRYHPANAEILGREVVRIPGGARLADLAASPTYVVIALATVAGLVVLAASAGPSTRRRRRLRTEEPV